MIRPLLRAVLLLMTAGLVACSSTSEGVDYDAIFVTDGLVPWAITVTDESWRVLLQSPEQYVPARVEVDGTVYEPVGLRFTGNPDRTKRSLRIRFNEYEPDLKFHGVKRVNLRNNTSDPTLIREALALHLFRAAGVPAPRASFVWVTVNTLKGGAGGVYTLVEQIDKKFLEDRFDNDDGGDLYQLERGADLTYQGESPADYDPAIYELKTNEATSDRSGLVRFIKVLNETPSDQLEAELPRVLDVDGLLLALAVNSWLANLDAYPGTADNYYLYEDRDGRFRYIPWDLNLAFGNYHGTLCSFTTDEVLALDPLQPTCGGDRPLVDRVLQVPAFVATYRAHLQSLVDGALAPAAVEAEIETRRALIAEAALEDTLKNTTNDEFETAFTSDVPDSTAEVRTPGLIPFVASRDAAVREMLNAATP